RSEHEGRNACGRGRRIAGQGITDEAIHRDQAGIVDQQQRLAAGQQKDIAVCGSHRHGRRYESRAGRGLALPMSCHYISHPQLRPGSAPMQEEILEFWFGRPGTADYGSTRRAWFGKDAAFDAATAYRFGAAIETALSGGFTDWAAPR